MNRFFTRIGLLTALALTFLCAHRSAAQTSLQAGEIVFTSFDAKGSSGLTDTFSFVLLAPISSSTVIGFTDRGWNGSTWNVDNGGSESTLSWMSSSALPAGTEIMITSTSAYIATSGQATGTIIGATSPQGLSLQGLDQVIAFQGNLSGTPVVLAGLHWNTCSQATTDANWDNASSCSVTSSTSSLIPPGITPSTGAFFTGMTGGVARIGGKFNCTGVPYANAATARAAILDKTNWTFITTTTDQLSVPAACGPFIGVAAPSITANPSNSEVCAGNNATFTASASGSGISYLWQVSTTGTGGTYANLTNGGVYSNVTTTTLTITGATAAMNGYAYRLRASNGGGTTYSNGAVLTVSSSTPAFSIQPSDVTICPGTAGIVSGSATGGTVAYRWQGAAAGSSSFSDLADGGTYSGTATGSLTITAPAANMYGYQYRLSATNACGTSYSNVSKLTFRTSWTGATSTNWNVASNWSCNTVPDTSTDVVIGTATNQPLISSTAFARNITLNTGGTLTISGPTTLSLVGTITNAGGTFNASGTNATVNYNSTSPNQPIAGGTYFNVQFNGAGDKVLTGDVTVNGAASILTNNRVFLGNYNFIIASNANVNAGSTRYWVTNGTGGLKKMALGAASFVYPLGTTTSYTPFLVNNTGGVVDNFTGRVTDSVYANYVNDVPQGAAINTKVVNKTWYVTEDVPGGSNAQMVVQWNAGDEAPSFDRRSITFSHYVGGQWVPSTLQAASNGTGPGPYLATLNGITSFSPFGLGNIQTPLPVSFRSFTGSYAAGKTDLKWAVAEETNISRYEIERSENGQTFSAIGKQMAARNGSDNQQYAFTDANIAAGKTYYYRLRIVDLGGNGTYSAVVKIATGKSGDFDVTLNSNPVKSSIGLGITSPKAEVAQIVIYDMNGRKIAATSRDIQAGSQTVEIAANTLQSGSVYIVRVIIGNETREVKVTRE